MNVPTQFSDDNRMPCPKCGALNETSWVLCDQCNTRLPWAPPPKPPPNLNDLTEEELAARFGLLPKREPSFLANRRNLYLVITAVSLLISILWEVLQRFF